PGEIHSWLAQHAAVVDFPRWVALDDKDMREDLQNHMILTNKKVGLTEKLARQAVEQLNAQTPSDCRICSQASGGLWHAAQDFA
ncbi:unnamed protein product, partial [Polarella glacialis]